MKSRVLIRLISTCVNPLHPPPQPPPPKSAHTPRIAASRTDEVGDVKASLARIMAQRRGADVVQATGRRMSAGSTIATIRTGRRKPESARAPKTGVERRMHTGRNARMTPIDEGENPADASKSGCEAAARRSTSSGAKPAGRRVTLTHQKWHKEDEACL